jgi:hypothetical protein
MAARQMIHTTRSHFRPNKSLTHSEETKRKERRRRRAPATVKVIKVKKRRIERKE